MTPPSHHQLGSHASCRGSGGAVAFSLHEIHGKEATSEIIITGTYCLLTMCQALGCAQYGFSLNPQGSCIISIHIEVEQAEVTLERLGTQGPVAGGGQAWPSSHVYLASKSTRF